MREVVFTMIAGNPYIKNESKPQSKNAIMKLSIDTEEKEEVKKQKPLSPAEVEKIRLELMNKMNAK